MSGLRSRASSPSSSSLLRLRPRISLSFLSYLSLSHSVHLFCCFLSPILDPTDQRSDCSLASSTTFILYPLLSILLPLCPSSPLRSDPAHHFHFLFDRQLITKDLLCESFLNLLPCLCSSLLLTLFSFHISKCICTNIYQPFQLNTWIQCNHFISHP